MFFVNNEHTGYVDLIITSDCGSRRVGGVVIGDPFIPAEHWMRIDDSMYETRFTIAHSSTPNDIVGHGILGRDLISFVHMLYGLSYADMAAPSTDDNGGAEIPPVNATHYLLISTTRFVQGRARYRDEIYDRIVDNFAHTSMRSTVCRCASCDDVILVAVRHFMHADETKSLYTCVETNKSIPCTAIDEFVIAHYRGPKNKAEFMDGIKYAFVV